MDFKMEAKTPIFVSLTWLKFKNHYLKNIFNKILLKVGENEYIYTAEMKFEKQKYV